MGWKVRFLYLASRSSNHMGFIRCTVYTFKTFEVKQCFWLYSFYKGILLHDFFAFNKIRHCNTNMRPLDCLTEIRVWTKKFVRSFLTFKTCRSSGAFICFLMNPLGFLHITWFNFRLLDPFLIIGHFATSSFFGYKPSMICGWADVP